MYSIAQIIFQNVSNVNFMPERLQCLYVLRLLNARQNGHSAILLCRA